MMADCMNYISLKNQFKSLEWIVDTEIPCFDLEIVVTRIVAKQLKCRIPHLWERISSNSLDNETVCKVILFLHKGQSMH